MKAVSKNLDDTRKIAADVLSDVAPSASACVFALSGDLGAGKTAFAQAVGEITGVSDTMQSPTYVIEKIYDIEWNGFKKLVHIDAYRLEAESELAHLGWSEIAADPANLILVEWPEKVAGLIPADAKRISFITVDETTREISYA